MSGIRICASSRDGRRRRPAAKGSEDGMGERLSAEPGVICKIIIQTRGLFPYIRIAITIPIRGVYVNIRGTFVYNRIAIINRDPNGGLFVKY
jgi:hypothetical protein